MHKSNKKRILSYSESINEALNQSMTKDKNVVLLGLGVDDPKGIFGTTLNLKKKFPKRVYDMPTCENSFTGFAVGLALEDKKPVIVHQRVEFSLLSFDQIINQAAKWLYMTGGRRSLPIVIRLIIGRGWGQGPQHSQSLEVLFAHIPGLKVVCPSDPYSAKGLLISAIQDKNPVIFFEHRWLHDIKGNVPNKSYTLKIGKSKYISKGKDLTIISFSYSTIEAIKVTKILKENNIFADHIDLLSLRPIDKQTIIKSARKTKRVLIIDNGWKIYGVSSEIISILVENLDSKISVERVGNFDAPIPSTVSLAKYSYPNQELIIKKVIKLIGKKIKYSKSNYNNTLPDQPNTKFLGPF